MCTIAKSFGNLDLAFFIVPAKNFQPHLRWWPAVWVNKVLAKTITVDAVYVGN